MAELADKLRNKTLTVGEALDLAVSQKRKGIDPIKDIKSFGSQTEEVGDLLILLRSTSSVKLLMARLLERKGSAFCCIDHCSKCN